MILTRSLTSGLTQRSTDPADVFWGVGDRGPNIKPADAVRRYGLAQLAPLATIDGAKIMPLPEAGPSIARFRLVNDTVELDEVIRLRAPDGTPLSGLAPPSLPGMEFEPVFTLDGAALSPAYDGVDTEGIAARADGRFWIADEYGPSLLLVGPDGVVAQRLVPEGASQMFSGSSIPTEERLPAIGLARKLNRGFEALSLSCDNETLFVALQSPLAHPDRHAHDNGDIVRIWALDPSTGEFRAEYVYPLDDPQAFVRDCEAGSVTKSDVKVSELVSLPDGSLLVLERVTLSTHIYRVRPESALAAPTCFLDPEHRPTLEQIGQAGAKAANIPLLSKQLVVSTDDHPEICGDLEGMIVLDDDSMLLANDSDYGIEGAVTQFWRISLSEAARQQANP
jgi:Esterase-like activity of phytase